MSKSISRNLLLGFALAATAIAGTAYAEQATRAKRHADGTVTRSEIQADSAARFARLDVNQDNRIDSADRQARRNALFDRLDTDRNGQLSRAEFGTGRARAEGNGRDRRGMGPRGGRHGPGMARMADADKDGAVSSEEFTAAALQRFDRMDANKDGRVTGAERQAARKARREQWRSRHQSHAAAAPSS